MEEWRDVAGYEGLYEVSNLGRIRSHYGGKVRYIKCIKEKGYLYLNLYKNGKMKRRFVHRLVYESFRGQITDGRQVDHIDGNKENNTLSNLRAVTPRENVNNPATRVRYLEAIKKVTSSEQWKQKTRDAAKRRSENPQWRNNVRKAAKRRSESQEWCINVRKGAKKRSESQDWRNNNRDANRRRLAKPILQIDKDTNEVVRRWECMSDATREIGVNRPHISQCCHGKRKTAGGFRWRYATEND